MTDTEYLKIAIQNSIKSMTEGNFPAGAIVVKDNKIIASEISSPFPNLFHADSKAVSSAFIKYGPLTGATLYIGLESCLMCSSVAYWAGIRRIVFAVPKSKVSSMYYESGEDTAEIIDSFHDKIVRVHLSEMEEEALAVVRSWEEKNVK